MQYGVSSLAGKGEINCAHPSVIPTISRGPGDSILCPSLPFPGSEQSARGKGKADYTSSHLTEGAAPVPLLRLCFSLVYWSLTKDLAFASFSVYHCENFLGSLSIFPLLLSQALINLLGAPPGTPSNSYGAKDLLRRRRAAPTAAPLLWYNTDAAGISCEANIIRSFFHPLSYGTNGDFLKIYIYISLELGIPVSDPMLLRGKKCLQLLENVVLEKTWELHYGLWTLTGHVLTLRRTSFAYWRNRTGNVH